MKFSYDPQAVVPKLRGWLHLVATPLSGLAGIWLIWSAQTTAARIACLVFIATALNLFGVSATYHRGKWSIKTKIALRRYDHSNIFLIIAGTYTPIAVVLLNESSARMLLIIIWTAAIAGVLVSVLWPHAPRWVTVPLYLTMGWISVLYIPQMLTAGGWVIVGFIALGGVLYSVGAVIYGIKKPNISHKWFGFHELFHAFTIAAFIAHFVAIALTV
ncbi:MAG: hypothetical protein RL410_158 [Actinomycetota bacterium]|jgi:hemolysin III